LIGFPRARSVPREYVRSSGAQITVGTPRDSKYRWNISNSVSVGRPRQSTIAIAGERSDRERCARSIAVSWRPRVGTTLQENFLRNIFMTGSDANTCASSSL